ncbi:MAG: FKBP-type peptidyl-prolyl cis-trans isomerase [Phycisphaerales bacterium]|nr:FKBP-type peptidyl-prolyl cis-trans isomerase [Planctomycetota bacterium]
MDKRKLVVPGLLLSVLLIAGCNSDGSQVTPGDRPNENGDSGAVEEQMADAEAPRVQAADSRMEERQIDAQMRQQAQPKNQDSAPAGTPAGAASTQPAASPAPQPAAQPAAAAPKADAKPQAKAEPAPESKAAPDTKAAPKPEVKTPVTFLNCDASPALGTKKLDDGLVIEELRMGDGAECKTGATVTINYHGTLKSNGDLVDTTRAKQPATFPLNRLIKGWQEGVPGMKVGGIRRLTIPYQLAYGDAGRPPVVPPKSDLIFIIELIQISEPSK